MEVRVKYQVISKATISSLSFNHKFNLIGAVADGSDTATFYTIGPDLSLYPRFVDQSRPPSASCISWSPNGTILAVANIKVELWTYQNYKLAPLKVIHQGFIEIKNLTWSQDSRYYLCYGVNHKDNPISINIRHIQSNQFKQIFPQDQPVMVSFDPFGKYIAVLTLKNILDLYDARSLDKIKSISLAETKNDVPTLKDRRTCDWSPQYSYFACINLNDNRIHTAMIFDRNRNFAIKDIFVGHQATISCAKFNPHVYEFQLDTTFILAIGDSSGCISIWRVGKNNSYKQPLFIMSSPNKAEQSVEGLQWNRQGDTLIINVLKKYVIIVNFKLQDFGKKLSEQQKSNLIIGTYGATGASQIAGATLQVFGLNDFNLKNQLQLVQQPKMVCQNNFQPQQKPKQNMIKTKQQTIYQKDVNNKQKKRIIPSRLIPQSQYIQKSTTQIQKQQPTITINSTTQQTNIAQKQKLPTLKLPPLKQQIKRQYLLPNENILQIENIKNVVVLSIRSKNISNDGKDYPIKRFFNQDIKLLNFTHKHILVITGHKLFVFDFTLELVQLPCFIGDVCNFAANNTGTIYYMATNGLIKGFNYIRNQFICETSAAYLLLTDQQSEITTNPFTLFAVFDDDSDRLHIQIKTTFTRYFFCKQQNKWVAFDFDKGFYQIGHSLRITKLEKQNTNNFYSNLINPAIISSQSKTQSVVNQYQLQLIYYGKYNKDINKYKQSLLRLLVNIKIKGSDQQMRKQINKYFIDQNSNCYVDDNELREKVKKIGGKVIEQFVIMGKI